MENISTTTSLQPIQPISVKHSYADAVLSFLRKLSKELRSLSLHFSSTGSADYATPSVAGSFYSQTSSSDSFSATRQRRKFNVKRYMKSPFFIPGAIALVVLVLLAVFLSTRSSSPTQALGAKDQRVQVQKPIATQTLNKEFLFPLNDANGKEISKIRYIIQRAETQNQIIVKGVPSTAVKGRRFLILNLKLTNNYTKSIQINARDYVRLVIAKSPEKLAPDVHNDPVELQAISTKETRVAFVINDTDKDLEVQVGEITGPKQTFALAL